MIDAYDGVVCDLDGVVYRGTEAVPEAVQSLTSVLRAGKRLVYATNNASRTPADVATQLRGFGLTLQDSDVVTSSQAGAARLAERVRPGSSVLAVGGNGVRAALSQRGFEVVDTVQVAGGRTVDAVLQGYGADVGWRDLAEASYAVAGGAVWVATNDDLTLPTERGTAPGNGTLVAAVAAATKTAAEIVGKPHTPLYELSVEVLGTTTARTLAVGDRLDTDIAGANAAGIDSLLVLTGVSTIGDVARAGKTARPRFVARDLRCLGEPYPPVTAIDRRSGKGTPVSGSGAVSAEHGWACGDAQVEWHDGRLYGLDNADLECRLRAALAAIWSVSDGAQDHARRDAVDRWLTTAVDALTRMVEAETR